MHPGLGRQVEDKSRAKQKLESVQRRGAQIITPAYKTVSKSAVLVLDSVPPIEFLARERQDQHRELKIYTLI